MYFTKTYAYYFTNRLHTVIKKIKQLNKDENINGIILQLPIPKNFNEDRIINTISPSKDVDGLTDISISNLYSNKEGFIPCTPKGILEIFNNVIKREKN